MPKIIACCLILCLAVPVVASAQVARELVGKYQMDVQGGDIIELRADGTAAMAGEEMKWAARGNQLSVGTYAGQSNTAGAMQWRLENLQVYVDQGNGTGFQDIGLTATKNSNGSVILHAGGREYSMCR